MQALQVLEMIVGYLACGIVGLFGLALIVRIFQGKIDLSKLLSDDDGAASTSRFQLMIFTFVVALSFFLVVVSNVKLRQTASLDKTSSSPTNSPLPDVPGGVLSLLGISASSYLVSRGISASQPDKPDAQSDPPKNTGKTDGTTNDPTKPAPKVGG